MIHTRITIIRHGETEWNRTNQLQGNTDSPLTKKGILQAELLSETLTNRKYDILISSNLGRARHTADIINKKLNLKRIENSTIRERNFGIIEGFTREQIKTETPEIFKAYLSDNYKFSIPKGESLYEFYNRTITGIEQITNSYKNNNILLVAHGGTLDCIIRKIFNLKLTFFRNYKILNTSINSFVISDKLWELEEWGNISHLFNTSAMDEINIT